jgi:hypothetical protein
LYAVLFIIVLTLEPVTYNPFWKWLTLQFLTVLLFEPPLELGREIPYWYEELLLTIGNPLQSNIMLSAPLKFMHVLVVASTDALSVMTLPADAPCISDEQLVQLVQFLSAAKTGLVKSTRKDNTKSAIVR